VVFYALQRLLLSILGLPKLFDHLPETILEK